MSPGRGSLLAALTCAIPLMGCRGHEESSQAVVAMLDGRAVHRFEFDAYVAAALARSGGVPQRGDERDRVLSRLLDDYLNEEILLREAERRGVSVTDQEIASYLSEEEPSAAAHSRETQSGMARRHLAIRKLQEAFVRAGSEVSERDVEKYLAERGVAPRRHVVLRTLKFAAPDEAQRVRGEILSGRSGFREQVEARDPELGAPLTVAIETLPPEVRGALEGLEPGRPSEPVALRGAVYLFELEPGEDEDEEEEDPAEARRRVRSELQRIRAEQASRALIEALRKAAVVEIRHEALPFRYVAETP